MSLPWSLRGRLLLGAAFWTIGLFFLAIVLWHVTRRSPFHAGSVT